MTRVHNEHMLLTKSKEILINEQQINLAEQFTKSIEVDKFVKEAKYRGIDLGRNPKRTLASWERHGLIPSPIKMVESALHEEKYYYPEITLELICLIRQEQSKGKSLQDIKEQLLRIIIFRMIVTPDRKRASLRSFIKKYGMKYGFYKKPAQMINAAFEASTITQKLNREEDVLKTIIHKRESGQDAKVSTWYTDNCILCQRLLIGRGTKDHYTIDQIRRVIPTLSKKYESIYPFGVYACRSVRKCGTPNLLYLLRVKTDQHNTG